MGLGQLPFLQLRIELYVNQYLCPIKLNEIISFMLLGGASSAINICAVQLHTNGLIKEIPKNRRLLPYGDNTGFGRIERRIPSSRYEVLAIHAEYHFWSGFSNLNGPTILHPSMPQYRQP